MATLDKNATAMVVDSPTNVSLTVRLIMQGKVSGVYDFKACLELGQKSVTRCLKAWHTLARVISKLLATFSDVSHYISRSMKRMLVCNVSLSVLKDYVFDAYLSLNLINFPVYFSKSENHQNKKSVYSMDL